MNSNTTPTSGNHAQRSSINKNHGDGSMLSQLEHRPHHDTPVKMSALHDRTADSRIAGDDFGGLPPKDYSDSGAGSKQRDSGFIDFTPTAGHAKVYHGLNPMFFKKQAGHDDYSPASSSHDRAHDDHNNHHGNHTGFSITGLSTLSHKDPSSHAATGLAMPMHSSDLSLGALYGEDQASSVRKDKPHQEDKSDSSQSTPLGHQTHRVRSPSSHHTLMPHDNKAPEYHGDRVSSQDVHQPSHSSEQDRDGLFDSAHPSTFPSAKHKKKSKGGDKSHEPEINIGELPKHDRFNGPVEYLEDDGTISQHAQHSQGTPSSVALGVGAGLVSLGAAAAAASHHISNPPAVNYAGQKAYDAPMTHHDGSSADRAAVPQGSFFTQPTTYLDAPSHGSGAHPGNHAPSAHSGISEPHPSSTLASHSVPASRLLDAHEQTLQSDSHVSSGPARVSSAAINHHHKPARPVHHAPVHIETIHEAYHGPTTQGEPVSGHSHQQAQIETIHKPYDGGLKSSSLTGTKESELGQAGSQSSTGTRIASSVPLSVEPKKKKWLGFEVKEKKKDPNRPPRALALGFGFKEIRKAAMAAAKAGQAPHTASISAPISTPIATPSAPASISAQGVQAASDAIPSSSDPAATSVQDVHANAVAGPSSSGSVSSPAIVSVKPIHHVGRSSPAPHSFSPSQDRPVHPDISYHTKKKSKTGGKSLFSTPVVPAGMSRSHVPPKAPVSTPAPGSAPVPVVASSSKKAPISSSNALSGHVSGLTYVPVHSQYQHHANSPVTPEMLAAAVAAGTTAAISSHRHGLPEKAPQHATATPVHTATTESSAPVVQSVAHAPLPATSMATAHGPAPAPHTDNNPGKAATAATLVAAPVIAGAVERHSHRGPKPTEKSIPENVAANYTILPHGHSTAATLKKPKVDLSLYPEEEGSYPRGEESHHENPARPVPHGHSTAATLKKPKVDLSLYPEEEGSYPRGEESHHENPAHPDHPVAIQEVQLDAEDQHTHNDLHHSKTATAAGAVALGLGGITLEKPISDLASARAAAASALETSPTLDDSKSNFATSENAHFEEGSSISARKAEPVVGKSATTVLVTDKATLTDPSVGVSSHQATSEVPAVGSHPVHAEIGTSTHPVDVSAITPTTSKSDAAVPLTIAAAAVTAPLAAHALGKHIDKSTISKPISATPLAEDSTKKKVHHIVKEADPSSVTKISVAAAPSSIASVIPHKDDEEIIMLTTTTTTTVPEKDRKAPKKNKETLLDKPADDITNISMSPATPAVAAIIPHEADEEVVMMKTTTIQHVPKSSIAIATEKMRAKIDEKLHHKSVDKTAVVTETPTSADSKTPIASASASKTSSGIPVTAAAVAAIPIVALAAIHDKDTVETHEVVDEAHVVTPDEETHEEPANEIVADDDAVEPVVAAAVVETEKERKKREKNELKKERKELKAKEKAEKKALKEKQKKPTVDISGKLSSIAAPAVAAIAAASALDSYPHNKNTEPIKLKGQNFLLTESDVQHPTIVPVSQTLRLTENDIVHPSVPIVSQRLTMTEDDVMHPSVPIVSQRLTMTEDDVEKPVLVQPARPVLRVLEHDVPKPEITHGHLVIPKVAPKAVSTSALKVASAPRPMIPPRVIKEKKEKVKTDKKMKLPVVRMPRFRKKKTPKIKKEKKPAVVEESKALATVPVVETIHVLETPKPNIVETHVVEAPKPVVEIPKAVVPVVATTVAASKVLEPPKPVVMQEVKTHHVEVPKPAAIAAVTNAAAVPLPPSPKPAPIVVETKVVEPPKPVVVEHVKSHLVEPPKPVPLVAPIVAAPVVAAASSAMKPTAITTTHEQTPATQKEEITAESMPVVRAPEGYSGPIPSIHSGETVVWVKKIRTSQEYYDSEDEDDFDDFGYRKDRDPSRYLAPQMPRGMSNADQRVNYHLRNHTRPGSADAYAQQHMPAQHHMPAQQQRQGLVGNDGGYNTQPRQSAL